MKATYRNILVMFVAVSASAFIGCKDYRDNKNRDSAPVVADRGYTSSDRSVASFALQDPACQKSSGLTNLGNQVVNRWKKGTTQAETLDFSSLSATGDNGLKGKYIGVTIVGLHKKEIKSCSRLATGELQCASEGEELVSSGTPLLLCNSNYSYNRNSVEGVALATAATIEEAGKFYTDNVPSGRQLDPVWSLVLPNFDVEYRGNSSSGGAISVTEAKSDNASWGIGRGKRPDGGTSEIKIITVFPPSLEFQKTNSLATQGLWELPFVVAHEFGHHVFYSNVLQLRNLFSQATSIVSQSNNTYNFESISAIIQEKSSKNSENIMAQKLGAAFLPGVLRMATTRTRTVSVSDSMIAINEAFADLFAEYSVGGVESMKAIPGLCDNRNLASNYFSFAGKEFRKSLDTKEMTEFLSSTRGTSRASDSNKCESISYQDPHTIGAIMAAGFNSLLGETKTKIEKTQILVKWAQSLDLEVSLAGSSPKKMLENAIWSAIEKIALSQGGALNAAQCSAFNDSFPAIAGVDPQKIYTLGCIK